MIWKKQPDIIFLGVGPSTSTVYYLETDTNKIKRARHVYFDDFAIPTPDDQLSLGAHILRN